MAKKAVEVKELNMDMLFAKIIGSAVKHLKRTDDNGNVYRGIRLDMYQTKKDLKAILMVAGVQEHQSWAKTNIGCSELNPCMDCIECAFKDALAMAIANGLVFSKDIPKKDKKSGVMHFLYTPEEWNPTKNVDREMLNTVMLEARSA